MKLRNNFFILSLALASSSLAAGYGLAGQWLGVGGAVILGLAWLLARKYPAMWLSLICLLTSMGLAVAGCLTGAVSVWMILGAGLALAVWDLLLLEAALEGCAFEEQTRRYESQHLRSLALAVGAGLLAALLGRGIPLQLPFIVLVFSASLVILGLDRIWNYLKKTV